MAQTVGQDQFASPDQCRDSSDIGEVAGAKSQRGFGARADSSS
jgi:hypothetical protein